MISDNFVNNACGLKHQQLEHYRYLVEELKKMSKVWYSKIQLGLHLLLLVPVPYLQSFLILTFKVFGKATVLIDAHMTMEWAVNSGLDWKMHEILYWNGVSNPAVIITKGKNFMDVVL